MTTVYDVSSHYPELDPDDGCWYTSAGPASFNNTVTAARVLQESGSTMSTPYGIDVSIHGDEDDSNPKNSWPINPNYSTAILNPTTSTDGDWEAHTNSTSDLGNLVSCGTCDFDLLAVEIADSYAAAAGECINYLVLGLYACFSNPPQESTRLSPMAVKTVKLVPSESTCVAGSGRFQLLQTNWRDRDNDGNRTHMLRPVQVNGTGVLTSAARINRIASVDNWGSSLKLVRGINSLGVIGTDDSLQAVSGLVTTITTNESTFTGASVRGGTPFVLVEHPHNAGDYEPDIQVDLEWTCGQPLLAEEVQMDKGYTTALSDLTCIGGWDQELVLRVEGSGDSRLLHIDMYGVTDLRYTTPLLTINGESSFSVSTRGLEVAGSVLSESTNSMQIELDKVEYLGIPLCIPNQYTLPIED